MHSVVRVGLGFLGKAEIAYCSVTALKNKKNLQLVSVLTYYRPF